MKWLRSLVAVGAGVAVGFALFTFFFALGFELWCWDDSYRQGSCADIWFPGFAIDAARAIAGRHAGPPETWQVNAAFISWLASIGVAGFVADLLAPGRRLGHAIAVGPLVVVLYLIGGRMDISGPRDVLWVLAWSLPAALGGMLGWWVARRRARFKPES